MDQEVEFISSGIANVGYYDASAGQIIKLTEIGSQSGYYTVGQPLPNSGIITGHYFVVSNNGNNIGAGNTYIQTGVTTSYVGDWVAGIGTNQWGILSFSSATVVPLSSNSNNLDGQFGSYYLDYNNFTNTPTIPTNNNQLTNGAGYVTSSGTVALSEGLTGTPDLNVGIVTATSFSDLNAHQCGRMENGDTVICLHLSTKIHKIIQIKIH